MRYETWQHGEMETWAWRHGRGDMDLETLTWRHGHGDMDMETHCKPSPFGKQFCLANTAIFSSYITFQNIQKKIFYPKQM